MITGIGYNGLDAVNLYREKKPNIILIDLDMPEYNGCYAIKRIREKDSEVKIFVITGNMDCECEDLVTEIIAKPLDFKTIMRFLENIKCQK